MFYPYAFHMQYVVREAAKSAGLWSSAPTMEVVTPQQMEKFNSVVRLALVCDMCHLNNTNEGGSVMHIILILCLYAGLLIMSLTEECTQKAASPPEKFSIKSEMHTTANQKEIPLQEVMSTYCMDLRYNPPPPH